jgi:hypothetical protein
MRGSFDVLPGLKRGQDIAQPSDWLGEQFPDGSSFYDMVEVGMDYRAWA